LLSSLALYLSREPVLIVEQEGCVSARNERDKADSRKGDPCVSKNNDDDDDDDAPDQHSQSTDYS
jgi:hypothetical protein